MASSSLRRRAQLLARRPDLQVEEIRGSLERARLQQQELELGFTGQGGFLKTFLHFRNGAHTDDPVGADFAGDIDREVPVIAAMLNER